MPSRRVLIVSVCFPPLAEVGSQRPARLCRYLPDHGWEPAVLTVSLGCARPRDDSLMDLVPPGLRVYRTACGNWYRHSYAYRHWQARGLSRLLHVPFHMLARVVHGGMVPDDCVTWRPAALHRAEQIRREFPFDVVLACMSPWSVGLAARDIAERFRVPYVLDLRDPWTASPERYAPRNLALERALERELIARAAAFVANTQGQERLHLDVFGDLLHGRTTVVNNSFDPREWDGVRGERFEKFTMLFTGNVHRWVSLAPLIQALRQLRDRKALPAGRYELLCHGTAHPSERARVVEMGLTDCVRFERTVPRLELMPKVLGAQLLVATVRWPFAVPAKVYNYLGAGGPILMIGPQDGDAARIVRETGCGFTAGEDEVEQIAEVVLRAFRSWAAGRPILDHRRDARHQTGQTRGREPAVNPMPAGRDHPHGTARVDAGGQEQDPLAVSGPDRGLQYATPRMAARLAACLDRVLKPSVAPTRALAEDPA